MLQEIGKYDLASDYIAKEEAVIQGMTLEQHKALANKYLDEAKMVYLLVGDAATQFEQFKNAGFDEVKLLDNKGKEVELTTVKM